jgi:hypothetical protein
VTGAKNRAAAIAQTQLVPLGSRRCATIAFLKSDRHDPHGAGDPYGDNSMTAIRVLVAGGHDRVRPASGVGARPEIGG